MASENSKASPDSFSSSSGLNFDDTELSLCLPGETRLASSSKKRAFSENVDLSLACSSSGIPFRSKYRDDDLSPDSESSDATNIPPPAKAQVVGWPPVKSSRKNMIAKSSGKYVKVAGDGTPYLRKVDLEMYSDYKQLLAALEDMFTGLTICNVNSHGKAADAGNGMQYVPTYEDKDGDWMLVGDVPWKMFVDSCQRIRLMMKTSETADQLLSTKISTN